MSLSEFMPYGAPELIDGASPRLARSTLVASGFVALMVWGLGMIAAQRPAERVVPPEPIPVFNPDEFHIEQPPSAQPPIVKIVDPRADYRAVPEAPPLEPVIEPRVDNVGPVGPVGPDQDRAGENVGGSVGPAPPRDPDVGEYVYTDELPQPVRLVKPSYTDIAREAGIEGTVKLMLLIGLDGHVQRAVVQKNGSVPMLDEAAITAAMASLFTPALANGHPVKVWVAQDYRFKLH